MLSAHSAQANCEKATFSDVGWTDITATTAVSTVILEALGYETDVNVLFVPVTYASMAKGDIVKDRLVLIVPIRTHKAEQINFDSTCVLQKYEHEWLRFESYIEYKRARLVLADDLMNE